MGRLMTLAEFLEFMKESDGLPAGFAPGNFDAKASLCNISKESELPCQNQK